MTHFLASDVNPSGFKLEDVLTRVRADLLKRSGKIVDDHRPEAAQVLENDIRIMGLLSESIRIAEASTKLLDTQLGPHRDGLPRIGKA